MKIVEIIIILVFCLTLLLLCTPTRADTFNYKAAADITEYTTYAVIMADWAQTLQIKDKEDNYEKNAWLYGKQPERARVNRMMFLQLVGVYLFNNQWNVSDNIRYAINLGHTIARGSVVYNNLQLGLEVKF